MRTDTNGNRTNGHNNANAAAIRSELEKLRKPGRPSARVMELKAQLAEAEAEEIVSPPKKGRKPRSEQLAAEYENMSPLAPKKTRRTSTKIDIIQEPPEPTKGRRKSKEAETGETSEKQSKKAIFIPPIVQEAIEVEVEGVSDLIQHAWDPKTIRQMEDDQSKSVDRSSRGRKPPRVPEAEYDASRYIDDDGNDCAPAVQFKKCMVAAAGTIRGATTKGINTAVFVKSTTRNFNLVPIKHSARKPAMRTDMVKIGKFPNKTATPRYRPAYQNWKCTLRVEFISDIISAEQVVNLLDRGGFCMGIAEWRPERGGEFGRFRVVAVRSAKMTQLSKTPRRT